MFEILKWVMRTHFKHLHFKIILMSFDFWNTFLKIWDSIRIPITKVGIHLGVCGFIPSYYQECKCDSQVAFPACTFQCLYLGHKPKAMVVIILIQSLTIVDITKIFGNVHKFKTTNPLLSMETKTKLERLYWRIYETTHITNNELMAWLVRRWVA